MKLAIELNGLMVGHLEGAIRSFDFMATPGATEALGNNSLALSVSMPLTPTPIKSHANRRRNWFAELLPEGDQYEYMLQQGALRRGDTLAFLARYGRDVAGALQIWDVDDPTEPLTPSTSRVSEAEVRELLESPSSSPLANIDRLGKSSLGGVQPKIVLAREEDPSSTKTHWARALGGHPSTHILKPQLAGRLSSVIFDEEYGARLAQLLGLTGSRSEIQNFDGLNALVIERFDRTGGKRLHQEDFNQILGASGNQKYQEMGGVVTLARVAAVLTKFTSSKELRAFARQLILSVALGNLDMHTKNIGLLHAASGEIHLAPAYDVVPQAHMPNDGRLALAVNGKYQHATIARSDLVSEISSWGISRPKQVVLETLEELQTAIRAEAPHPRAFEGLHDDLESFVTNLLDGRATSGGHA